MTTRRGQGGRELTAGIKALAIVAGVAAICPVSAIAQTVVKVGVILTYSGTEAQAGDQIDKGLKLYVKEHGKELPPGVKVELVFRDDTGPNPEVAKRLATELITRDHVQFFTGVVWTPNAAAIAPLTAEAKVPFVIMNAAGVTIPRMSPYVVRVSYTLPQTRHAARAMGGAAGLEAGYTAVPDFAPGHESETAFIKAFTEAGGEIVGSVRYPVINPDFAPFFARIKDVQARCALCLQHRRQAIDRHHEDDGRSRHRWRRDSSGLGRRSHHRRGAAQHGRRRLGHQQRRELFRRRRRGRRTRHSSRRGNALTATRPSRISSRSAAGTAWRRSSTVVKATKGKFTADEAMAILKNWKNPDSPRGPITIDPETRDIVQNVYIRRVEKVEGKLANVEFVDFPHGEGPVEAAEPAEVSAAGPSIPLRDTPPIRRACPRRFCASAAIGGDRTYSAAMRSANRRKAAGSSGSPPIVSAGTMQSLAKVGGTSLCVR